MRLSILVAVVALSAGAAPAALGQEDAGYTRKGADTCISCHEDELSLAVFLTPHAVPGDADGPFGHGQLQCEACHGPGDAHSGRVRREEDRPHIPSFLDNDPTPVSQLNGYCLDCHDDEMGIGWHAGAHPADEVGCADCHVSHAATDPVMATSTQPEVCYDCHTLVRGETRKPFGHPLTEGKMDCSSCHGSHDEKAATHLVRETVNATCEQCHADSRGPYLWEHAPVSEDCGLCHAPHGSSHPGMLVKRGPLLCQSCHSQAGHPSIVNEPEGLASGLPSIYLLGQNCMNCHEQVHGSNHPSGSRLMR